MILKSVIAVVEPAEHAVMSSHKTTVSSYPTDHSNTDISRQFTHDLKLSVNHSISRSGRVCIPGCVVRDDGGGGELAAGLRCHDRSPRRWKLHSIQTV